MNLRPSTPKSLRILLKFAPPGPNVRLTTCPTYTPVDRTVVVRPHTGVRNPGQGIPAILCRLEAEALARGVSNMRKAQSALLRFNHRSKGHMRPSFCIWLPGGHSSFCQGCIPATDWIDLHSAVNHWSSSRTPCDLPRQKRLPIPSWAEILQQS